MQLLELIESLLKVVLSHPVLFLLEQMLAHGFAILDLVYACNELFVLEIDKVGGSKQISQRVVLLDCSDSLLIFFYLVYEVVNIGHRLISSKSI